MPSSVRDRLSCTYEVIYFFTRSPRYYFNLDAIRTPLRTRQRQTTRNPERRYPPAGTGSPTRASRTANANRGLSHLKASGRAGHPDGKNPGDIWTLSTAGFRGAHFATFPTTLVERPLLATCPATVCSECGRPAPMTCGCGAPGRVCCIQSPGGGQWIWLQDAGRVRRPRAARPPVERSAFAGFRFPPEVITVAVRWYLRYGLSYRDIEELLAERGPAPVEVTTDNAGPYLRVLDDLVPAAAHVTEQYSNNRIEADHGRLKARLRPMRGLKRFRSAAGIATGHAFVQNLRRGHYELATDVPPRLRLATAFTELALAM